MSLTIVRQRFQILWIQKNGAGEVMRPMSVVGDIANRHGLTDVTMPKPGREAEFGINANYKYIVKVAPTPAPGGLPTTSIEFDDILGIDLLQKKSDAQEGFEFQRRFTNCTRADTPTGWDKLEHFIGASVTSETRGAGPSREATDAAVADSVDISFEDMAIWLRSNLTAQTATDVDQNILSIAALNDPRECTKGFPGRDKILFIGEDDTGAAPGDVSFTVTGGNTWANLGTDAAPFTQNIGIPAIVTRQISKTQYRMVCGGQSIAGTAAQLAYADFNFGDTALAVATATWTANTITIADAADPDGVTAMLWPSFNEIFIATSDGAGDVGIYLSEDAAETDPGSPIYTGAQDINQFHQAPSGDIWAVGNSNTLLRGNCDGFTALTGPNAGTDNTAIAVSGNGVVWVGNSTNIYRSRNVDTGTWDTKKAFGGNFVVKHIHLVKGSSELVYVVLDDTTPGDGVVWLTADGGSTWEQVTALAAPNAGYNAAHFSDNGLDDGNLAIIVGDVDTTACIHKLAPETLSC